MTRGRKPKPTAIRRADGNPGKRGYNGLEPAAPEGMPDCPLHLSDLAQEEWQRIAGTLYGMGVLTTVDRAALAVETVGAARAAMAKQTGLDKKTVLNVRPAFLIVPASLKLKAEQLVAQNLAPASSGNVVPQSIRTLAPISEPRLDAASETAWHLAASPNQIDTIECAYLEGQQGAYIETRNGFDVDGVEIKCRLDFGAKAIDWRGLYKNPGA